MECCLSVAGVQRGPDEDAHVGRPAYVHQSPAGAAAFTAIFQEHYAGCLRSARRLVRDEGLAHEVVQEVFLAWWRTAGGSYRADRGELAAWLSTLTHHKAIDAVRTSERHRRLLAAAGSALPCQAEQRRIDEVVWWELGRQTLVAALATLTPAHREVLDLAYVHGLTQVQVADQLGIPLGTVKSRTHAGLRRLRRAVGRSWTPAGPTSRSELAPPASPTSSSQPRQDLGSRPQPSRDTVDDDIQSCVAALSRIASDEPEDRSDNALMLSEAAALFDKHGDAGMYGLVVALTRAAALGGARDSRTV